MNLSNFNNNQLNSAVCVDHNSNRELLYISRRDIKSYLKFRRRNYTRTFLKYCHGFNYKTATYLYSELLEDDSSLSFLPPLYVPRSLLLPNIYSTHTGSLLPSSGTTPTILCSHPSFLLHSSLGSSTAILPPAFHTSTVLDDAEATVSIPRTSPELALAMVLDHTVEVICDSYLSSIIWGQYFKQLQRLGEQQQRIREWKQDKKQGESRIDEKQKKTHLQGGTKINEERRISEIFGIDYGNYGGERMACFSVSDESLPVGLSHLNDNEIVYSVAGQLIVVRTDGIDKEECEKNNVKSKENFRLDRSNDILDNTMKPAYEKMKFLQVERNGLVIPSSGSSSELSSSHSHGYKKGKSNSSSTPYCYKTIVIAYEISADGQYLTTSELQISQDPLTSVMLHRSFSSSFFTSSSNSSPSSPPSFPPPNPPPSRVPYKCDCFIAVYKTDTGTLVMKNKVAQDGEGEDFTQEGDFYLDEMRDNNNNNNSGKDEEGYPNSDLVGHNVKSDERNKKTECRSSAPPFVSFPRRYLTLLTSVSISNDNKYVGGVSSRVDLAAVATVLSAAINETVDKAEGQKNVDGADKKKSSMWLLSTQGTSPAFLGREGKNNIITLPHVNIKNYDDNNNINNNNNNNNNNNCKNTKEMNKWGKLLAKSAFFKDWVKECVDDNKLWIWTLLGWGERLELSAGLRCGRRRMGKGDGDAALHTTNNKKGSENITPFSKKGQLVFMFSNSVDKRIKIEEAKQARLLFEHTSGFLQKSADSATDWKSIITQRENVREENIIMNIFAKQNQASEKNVYDATCGVSGSDVSLAIDKASKLFTNNDERQNFFLGENALSAAAMNDSFAVGGEGLTATDLGIFPLLYEDTKCSYGTINCGDYSFDIAYHDETSIPATVDSAIITNKYNISEKRQSTLTIPKSVEEKKLLFSSPSAVIAVKVVNESSFLSSTNANNTRRDFFRNKSDNDDDNTNEKSKHCNISPSRISLSPKPTSGEALLNCNPLPFFQTLAPHGDAHTVLSISSGASDPLDSCAIDNCDSFIAHSMVAFDKIVFNRFDSSFFATLAYDDEDVFEAERKIKEKMETVAIVKNKRRDDWSSGGKFVMKHHRPSRRSSLLIWHMVFPSSLFDPVGDRKGGWGARYNEEGDIPVSHDKALETSKVREGGATMHDNKRITSYVTYVNPIDNHVTAVTNHEIRLKMIALQKRRWRSSEKSQKENIYLHDFWEMLSFSSGVDEKGIDRTEELKEATFFTGLRLFGGRYHPIITIDQQQPITTNISFKKKDSYNATHSTMTSLSSSDKVSFFHIVVRDNIKVSSSYSPTTTFSEVSFPLPQQPFATRSSLLPSTSLTCPTTSIYHPHIVSVTWTDPATLVALSDDGYFLAINGNAEDVDSVRNITMCLQISLLTPSVERLLAAQRKERERGGSQQQQLLRKMTSPSCVAREDMKDEKQNVDGVKGSGVGLFDILSNNPLAGLRSFSSSISREGSFVERAKMTGHSSAKTRTTEQVLELPETVNEGLGLCGVIDAGGFLATNGSDYVLNEMNNDFVRRHEITERTKEKKRNAMRENVSTRSIYMTYSLHSLLRFKSVHYVARGAIIVGPLGQLIFLDKTYSERCVFLNALEKVINEEKTTTTTTKNDLNEYEREIQKENRKTLNSLLTNGMASLPIAPFFIVARYYVLHDNAQHYFYYIIANFVLTNLALVRGFHVRYSLGVGEGEVMKLQSYPARGSAVGRFGGNDTQAASPAQVSWDSHVGQFEGGGTKVTDFIIKAPHLLAPLFSLCDNTASFIRRIPATSHNAQQLTPRHDSLSATVEEEASSFSNDQQHLNTGVPAVNNIVSLLRKYHPSAIKKNWGNLGPSTKKRGKAFPQKNSIFYQPSELEEDGEGEGIFADENEQLLSPTRKQSEYLNPIYQDVTKGRECSILRNNSFGGSGGGGTGRLSFAFPFTDSTGVSPSSPPFFSSTFHCSTSKIIDIIALSISPSERELFIATNKNRMITISLLSFSTKTSSAHDGKRCPGICGDLDTVIREEELRCFNEYFLPCSLIYEEEKRRRKEQERQKQRWEKQEERNKETEKTSNIISASYLANSDEEEVKKRNANMKRRRSSFLPVKETEELFTAAVTNIVKISESDEEVRNGFLTNIIKTSGMRRQDMLTNVKEKGTEVGKNGVNLKKINNNHKNNSIFSNKKMSQVYNGLDNYCESNNYYSENNNESHNLANLENERYCWFNKHQSASPESRLFNACQGLNLRETFRKIVAASLKNEDKEEEDQVLFQFSSLLTLMRCPFILSPRLRVMMSLPIQGLDVTVMANEHHMLMSSSCVTFLDLPNADTDNKKENINNAKGSFLFDSDKKDSLSVGKKPLARYLDQSSFYDSPVTCVTANGQKHFLALSTANGLVSLYNYATNTLLMCMDFSTQEVSGAQSAKPNNTTEKDKKDFFGDSNDEVIDNFSISHTPDSCCSAAVNDRRSRKFYDHPFAQDAHSSTRMKVCEYNESFHLNASVFRPDCVSAAEVKKRYDVVSLSYSHSKRENQDANHQQPPQPHFSANETGEKGAINFGSNKADVASPEVGMTFSTKETTTAAVGTSAAESLPEEGEEEESLNVVSCIAIDPLGLHLIVSTRKVTSLFALIYDVASEPMNELRTHGGDNCSVNGEFCHIDSSGGGQHVMDSPRSSPVAMTHLVGTATSTTINNENAIHNTNNSLLPIPAFSSSLSHSVNFNKKGFFFLQTLPVCGAQIIAYSDAHHGGSAHNSLLVRYVKKQCTNSRDEIMNGRGDVLVDQGKKKRGLGRVQQGAFVDGLSDDSCSSNSSFNNSAYEDNDGDSNASEKEKSYVGVVTSANKKCKKCQNRNGDDRKKKQKNQVTFHCYLDNRDGLVNTLYHNSGGGKIACVTGRRIIILSSATYIPLFLLQCDTVACSLQRGNEKSGDGANGMLSTTKDCSGSGGCRRGAAATGALKGITSVNFFDVDNSKLLVSDIKGEVTTYDLVRKKKRMRYDYSACFANVHVLSTYVFVFYVDDEGEGQLSWHHGGGGDRDRLRQKDSFSSGNPQQVAVVTTAEVDYSIIAVGNNNSVSPKEASFECEADLKGEMHKNNQEKENSLPSSFPRARKKSARMEIVVALGITKNARDDIPAHELVLLLMTNDKPMNTTINITTTTSQNKSGRKTALSESSAMTVRRGENVNGVPDGVFPSSLSFGSANIKTPLSSPSVVAVTNTNILGRAEGRCEYFSSPLESEMGAGDGGGNCTNLHNHQKMPPSSLALFEREEENDIVSLVVQEENPFKIMLDECAPSPPPVDPVQPVEIIEGMAHLSQKLSGISRGHTYRTSGVGGGNAIASSVKSRLCRVTTEEDSCRASGDRTSRITAEQVSSSYRTSAAATAFQRGVNRDVNDDTASDTSDDSLNDSPCLAEERRVAYLYPRFNYLIGEIPSFVRSNAEHGIRTEFSFNQDNIVHHNSNDVGFSFVSTSMFANATPALSSPSRINIKSNTISHYDNVNINNSYYDTDGLLAMRFHNDSHHPYHLESHPPLYGKSGIAATPDIPSSNHIAGGGKLAHYSSGKKTSSYLSENQQSQQTQKNDFLFSHSHSVFGITTTTSIRSQKGSKHLKEAQEIDDYKEDEVIDAQQAEHIDGIIRTFIATRDHPCAQARSVLEATMMQGKIFRLVAFAELSQTLFVGTVWGDVLMYAFPMKWLFDRDDNSHEGNPPQEDITNDASSLSPSSYIYSSLLPHESRRSRLRQRQCFSSRRSERLFALFQHLRPYDVIHVQQGVPIVSLELLYTTVSMPISTHEGVEDETKFPFIFKSPNDNNNDDYKDGEWDSIDDITRKYNSETLVVTTMDNVIYEYYLQHTMHEVRVMRPAVGCGRFEDDQQSKRIKRKKIYNNNNNNNNNNNKSSMDSSALWESPGTSMAPDKGLRYVSRSAVVARWGELMQRPEYKCGGDVQWGKGWDRLQNDSLEDEGSISGRDVVTSSSPHSQNKADVEQDEGKRDAVTMNDNNINFITVTSLQDSNIHIHGSFSNLHETISHFIFSPQSLLNPQMQLFLQHLLARYSFTSVDGLCTPNLIFVSMVEIIYSLQRRYLLHLRDNKRSHARKKRAWLQNAAKSITDLNSQIRACNKKTESMLRMHNETMNKRKRSFQILCEDIESLNNTRFNYEGQKKCSFVQKERARLASLYETVLRQRQVDFSAFKKSADDANNQMLTEHVRVKGSLRSEHRQALKKSETVLAQTEVEVKESFSCRQEAFDKTLLRLENKLQEAQAQKNSDTRLCKILLEGVFDINSCIKNIVTTSAALRQENAHMTEVNKYVSSLNLNKKCEIHVLEQEAHLLYKKLKSLETIRFVLSYQYESLLSDLEPREALARSLQAKMTEKETALQEALSLRGSVNKEMNVLAGKSAELEEEFSRGRVKLLKRRYDKLGVLSELHKLVERSRNAQRTAWTVRRENFGDGSEKSNAGRIGYLKGKNLESKTSFSPSDRILLSDIRELLIKYGRQVSHYDKNKMNKDISSITPHHHLQQLTPTVKTKAADASKRRKADLVSEFDRHKSFIKQKIRLLELTKSVEDAFINDDRRQDENDSTLPGVATTISSPHTDKHGCLANYPARYAQLADGNLIKFLSYKINKVLKPENKELVARELTSLREQNKSLMEKIRGKEWELRMEGWVMGRTEAPLKTSENEEGASSDSGRLSFTPYDNNDDNGAYKLLSQPVNGDDQLGVDFGGGTAPLRRADRRCAGLSRLSKKKQSIAVTGEVIGVVRKGSRRKEDGELSKPNMLIFSKEEAPPQGGLISNMLLSPIGASKDGRETKRQTLYGQRQHQGLCSDLKPLVMGDSVLKSSIPKRTLKKKWYCDLSLETTTSIRGRPHTSSGAIPQALSPLSKRSRRQRHRAPSAGKLSASVEKREKGFESPVMYTLLQRKAPTGSIGKTLAHEKGVEDEIVGNVEELFVEETADSSAEAPTIDGSQVVIVEENARLIAMYKECWEEVQGALRRSFSSKHRGRS